MIYRNIFLSIFLTPITILSSYERLQELIIAQRAKKQEISDLGKITSKQEEVIKAMLIEEYELTRSTAAALTKISLFSWDESEKKEFLKEIDDFITRFNKALKDENIRGLLKKEIFDNKQNNYELGKIKLLIIKRLIEKLILMDLVQDYEKAFQEVLDIDSEIELLENQDAPAGNETMTQE